MRYLLFICIWLLPFAQGLEAQTISEGFETSTCGNTANAFFTGCFSDWGSACGSPDINSNFQGVSPAEGARYVHMYSQWQGFNCGNNATANRTEGVFFNQTFFAGETYKITYALRWTKPGFCHNSNGKWILTNGLANQTGSWQNCANDGGVTPATSASDQVIQTHSFTSNSTGWTYFTVNFTPNNNYSQLWLRLETKPNPGCSAFGEGSNTVYLDDFKFYGCENKVETTSIWPRTCILADFTVSGNYTDCLPLTATSVILQFWQNGVFTGVSVPATLNTSTGKWLYDGRMQDLVDLGLDFGNWYDVRPVLNLSNNTSILGSEFVAGLNNDLYFADQSDPIVSVNDDPTNFNPSMTRFCKGSPIFYHGIDPLSSNHFSAIRRRPTGSPLPYGSGNGNYAGFGWVNASLDGFNGDLNAQYGSFLQVGWEYQLYIASSNTGEECIAWTPVTVEFEIVDCCAPSWVLNSVPDCVEEGEEITVSVTVNAPLTANDIQIIYSYYNNYVYVSHSVIETPSSMEVIITFQNKYCSCEGEQLVFDIALKGCSETIWVMTDPIPCCPKECKLTKIVDWSADEECILINGNPARGFCIEVTSDVGVIGVLAGANDQDCPIDLHNVQITSVSSSGVYTICGYMRFSDPECTGHAVVDLILETKEGCCALTRPFSFPGGCVIDEECLGIKPDIQLIYVNRSASINVSLNIPKGQTVTVIDHNAGTTQTVTVGTIKCGPFAIDQNGTIYGGSNCNGITFSGPEGIDCRSVEGVRPSIPYFFEIQWGECTWIITGDYCRETLVYPVSHDGGSDGRSADVDRSSFDTANGQISVFPNPVDASGLLNFDLTALTTSVKAIQITDLYGKTIESFTPDQDQQVFQHQLAQPLHQGIYFVQFHLEDGSVSSTRLVAVQ